MPAHTHAHTPVKAVELMTATNLIQNREALGERIAEWENGLARANHS